VESPRAYFLLWFEIDGLNIVFFAERCVNFRFPVRGPRLSLHFGYLEVLQGLKSRCKVDTDVYIIAYTATTQLAKY